MGKLTSPLLSICAVLIACFFHGNLIKMKWVKEALLVWFIVPPILFFTGSHTLALLVLAIIASFFLLTNKSAQIPFFIITFPVLPRYVKFQIPFPGLNYLFTVDLVIIFGFIFFYNILNGCIRYRFTFVDFCVFSFSLLTSILSIRSLPFTSTLREIFGTIFTIVVPYLLFSKSYKNERDITNYLKYFVSTGIVLASIGLVSTVKQWDFFESSDPGYVAVFRYGWLRMSLGMSTTFLGVFLGFCVLIAWSGIIEKKYSPPLYLMTLLMSISVYMTVSRGAWLSITGQILFYFLYKINISNYKIISLLGLVFSGVGFYFLMSDNANSVDDFGTFIYRQQLYEASWEQFFTAPLFGDVDYLSASVFDPLRQGSSGFVDIVSYYLQIVLAYGFVGLLIFIIPYIVTIKQLISIREYRCLDDMDRRTAALITAMLLSFLWMVLTVSAIQNIGLFGWILLAISQAFINAMKTKQIKSYRQL